MATTLALDEPSATVEALDPRALALVPGAGGDDAERADPEIIELFIEEAGEEIESIQAQFPIWRDDPGREAELTSLRRSFHTLKGSGRMVGAMLIGDFAWSFENLLNRVINKTLEADALLVSLVAEAVDALPELLEQLEVGTPPPTDVAGLIERAAAMAEGREAPLPEPAAEPPEPEGTGTIQVEAVADLEAGGIDLMLPEEATPAEPEPAIDPVLLEILSKEVGGHLDTIDQFLAESAEGTPPFAVPEVLYRACHTLHGSVTMAKAEVAAELTAPLNRLVRHAYDHDVPVDETVLVAIGDTVRAMRELVETYPSPGAGAPDSAGLVARLQELDEQVEAQAAARGDVEAEAEPEAEAGIEAETGFEAEPRPTTDTAPQDEPAVEVLPDFDPEIAAIFAEEAAEILESCDAALAQMAGGAAGGPLLEELQRHLHTLKGGARMAGLGDMGDLSHDLEALVIAINSGRLALTPGHGALLQSVVDSLHGMRDQVAAGRSPARPDNLFEQLAAALAGEEAVAVEPPATLPEEPAAEADVAQTSEPDVTEPVEAAALEISPETPSETPIRSRGRGARSRGARSRGAGRGRRRRKPAGNAAARSDRPAGPRPGGPRPAGGHGRHRSACTGACAGRASPVRARRSGNARAAAEQRGRDQHFPFAPVAADEPDPVQPGRAWPDGREAARPAAQPGAGHRGADPLPPPGRHGGGRGIRSAGAGPVFQDPAVVACAGGNRQ